MGAFPREFLDGSPTQGVFVIIALPRSRDMALKVVMN